MITYCPWVKRRYNFGGKITFESRERDSRDLLGKKIKKRKAGENGT